MNASYLDRENHGLFLLACVLLAVLAELCFLHGQIGVSYLIFIVAFYMIIFLRFGMGFNHRRIGLLMMVSIWLLSASFLLYSNSFFYSINIVIIPVLVFSHVVLITRSNTFVWE